MGRFSGRGALHGEKEFLIGYDDAVQGARPAVLIFHDWSGPGPNFRDRAETLARMGYVAFAADIYGRGVRPKDNKEAAAVAGIFNKDRQLKRARARAGMEVLLKNTLTDPAQVAAIGYCFGGAVALELARSGANLAGVVTFHGSLATPTPEDALAIKAKVLVLHGADDPFVPPAQVAAFEDEMRQGGVDWQMVLFGGAVRSFSIPTAGSDKSSGAAYDEKAARRSWEQMKLFLEEVFKK